MMKSALLLGFFVGSVLTSGGYGGGGGGGGGYGGVGHGGKNMFKPLLTKTLMRFTISISSERIPFITELFNCRNFRKSNLSRV